MANIVTAGAEDAGQRIDNFIFKHLKGVPKARVYRAIRHGEVRVNQGRIKPEHRLQVGDRVRIPPLGGIRTAAPVVARLEVSQAIQDSIVYEDASLLVINKPPGLPVHGGSGIQGGVIELLQIIRPDLKFLELIHRLDRETSGCLLLAKKRSALLSWHERLRKRLARKQYLALVRGEWQGGAKRIEAALLKNILRSGERMVTIHPEGKAAVTFVKPLQIFRGMTLVEAYPLTGRTHQIRVHLQHIGYPIAADQKYGDSEFNRLVKNQGLKRLFLHAASISSDEFGLCIPLASDLQAFLEKIKTVK